MVSCALGPRLARIAFEAHRLVYRSTLGLRVIKNCRLESNKEEEVCRSRLESVALGLRVIKKSRLESNKEEARQHADAPGGTARWVREALALSLSLSLSR